MSQLTTHAQWNVGRASPVCAACQAAMAPGQGCFAALCEWDAVAAQESAASAPDASPENQAEKNASEKNAAPTLGLERLDYCESCWTAGRRPALPRHMFSFWKTSVPVPQAKKKLFVDDSVLLDVFSRLQDKTNPRDIRFRFVLALILMRKRLLKYEGMAPPSSPLPPPPAADSAAMPAPEIWIMYPRGAEDPVRVLDPHLTPEQITEVSSQLSQILAEEF